MSLIEKIFAKKDPMAEQSPKAGGISRSERPTKEPAHAPETRPVEKMAPPAAEPGASMEDLIRQFNQIESVLSEEEDLEVRPGEIRLTMPIKAVLEMLPASIRLQDISDGDPDEKIHVMIQDLFGQLGRGQVEARLADIVSEIPERYLKPDVAERLGDTMVLPLSVIVSHIPEEELERHLSRIEREPDLDLVPDVFGVEPPPPGARPEPELSPAAPGPTEAADWPRTIVRGVDLNRAEERALCKALPGVGPHLAARIVAARPFPSALDLDRVPGIGPRTFRHITGHARPAGAEARERINALLGGNAAEYPVLRGIAQRLAAWRGIRRCVISHNDGHLLATAWNKKAAETVGALAPQIMKSIRHYAETMRLAGLSAITLFVDPYPLFIVRAEDLLVSVFISRGALSIRRLELIEALAWELARQLHRHALVDDAKPPHDEHG